MEQTYLTENEVRLATARRLNYQGTARVSLDQIHFDPPLPQNLDGRKLQRLRKIFQKERCRRFDVQNHIPVIISQQDLTEALDNVANSQVILSTGCSTSYPLISFSQGQLWGLHGRHRIQVGTEFLHPMDRWWVVDLYLDDIDDELKNNLVEEYENERDYTDGEIYRKIRQYEGEQYKPFQQRWMARLAQDSQRCLQLFETHGSRQLRMGLDALLAIPGVFYQGMRISALHRLVAIKCDEEISNYLVHVYHFWSSLVEYNPLLMRKIDQHTVEKLQLFAPGASQDDTEIIRQLVLSGQVFAAFSNAELSVICERIRNADRLIPSLYTFFEDLEYLESCANSMKRVFGPPEETIYTTMKQIFTAPIDGQSDLHTDPSEFAIPMHARTECFDLGYRQLWLYAMRNYPLIPPVPERDSQSLVRPNQANADVHAVHEMARLAFRLGFHSPKIQELLDESPDRQIARATLLQARKPGLFRYDARHFDALIDQIVECFSTAVPHKDRSAHRYFDGSAVERHTRCGLPQMKMHNQDSPFLFIDHLHSGHFPEPGTVTTYFVRRCVYFAFFGRPSFHLISLSANNGKYPAVDVSNFALPVPGTSLSFNRRSISRMEHEVPVEHEWQEYEERERNRQRQTAQSERCKIHWDKNSGVLQCQRQTFPRSRHTMVDNPLSDERSDTDIEEPMDLASSKSTPPESESRESDMTGLEDAEQQSEFLALLNHETIVPLSLDLNAQGKDTIIQASKALEEQLQLGCLHDYEREKLNPSSRNCSI